jgi:hypothetical protein
MENLEDVLMLRCATDEAFDGARPIPDALFSDGIVVDEGSWYLCESVLSGRASSSCGRISDESPKGLVWAGRSPSTEDRLFREWRSDEIVDPGDTWPPNGSSENTSPKMFESGRIVSS